MSDDKSIILDDEKKDVIADHNYDNIQELSKPMPLWLSLIFFSTVTYGLIFLLHMASGAGGNQTSELNAKMIEIEKKQLLANSTASLTHTDPSNLLNEGHKVFAEKCAACHGDNGQGNIGPNLTDNYWIQGDGQEVAVETVIKNGVTAKGMPSWLNVLKPNELKSVVAYVLSLADTNVAGKEPQGTKVK